MKKRREIARHHRYVYDVYRDLSLGIIQYFFNYKGKKYVGEIEYPYIYTPDRKLLECDCDICSGERIDLTDYPRLANPDWEFRPKFGVWTG